MIWERLGEVLVDLHASAESSLSDVVLLDRAGYRAAYRWLCHFL